MIAPIIRWRGIFPMRATASGKYRTHQRFLMIKEHAGSGQTSAPLQIVVVQNWLEELKRLVPMN
jgi:hypothetical protein